MTKATNVEVLLMEELIPHVYVDGDTARNEEGGQLPVDIH